MPDIPESITQITSDIRELFGVVYPELHTCSVLAKKLSFFNFMVKLSLDDKVLSAISTFAGNAVATITYHQYNNTDKDRAACILALKNAYADCIQRISHATRDPGMAQPAFDELNNHLKNVIEAVDTFYHRALDAVIYSKQF